MKKNFLIGGLAALTLMVSGCDISFVSNEEETEKKAETETKTEVEIKTEALKCSVDYGDLGSSMQSEIDGVFENGKLVKATNVIKYGVSGLTITEKETLKQTMQSAFIEATGVENNIAEIDNSLVFTMTLDLVKMDSATLAELEGISSNMTKDEFKLYWESDGMICE